MPRRGSPSAALRAPRQARTRTEFFAAYDRDNCALDDKTVKEELLRVDPQQHGSPVDLHCRSEVQEL